MTRVSSRGATNPLVFFESSGNDLGTLPGLARPARVLDAIKPVELDRHAHGPVTPGVAGSSPVRSANHQANTGLRGPCFISTYISTYIEHHPLPVFEVWCWCDDKVGTLFGSPSSPEQVAVDWQR